MCKYDAQDYKLDERAINFLIELEKDNLIQENCLMNIKQWDKVYQKQMDVFRAWITSDKKDILNQLNGIIFQMDWDKYAKGTISAWEMEALCYYYHEHELSNVNRGKYGFMDFYDLPEEPVIERSFTKGGKTINMFKLIKICGTCIAKDKNKGHVILLTCDGVVTVKFRKEYFAMFDKQLSVKNPDGTKTVVEKSWFNRGNMIVVQGMRSGDNFIAKKYASSGGHQLYRISSIDENGDLSLQTERYQVDKNE
jgi:DNA polymerase-3 subunit alpha